MLGKELKCMSEIGNVHDLYVVGVVRQEQELLNSCVDHLYI